MYLVTVARGTDVLLYRGFAFRYEAQQFFQAERRKRRLMERPIAPATKQRTGREQWAHDMAQIIHITLDRMPTPSTTTPETLA